MPTLGGKHTQARTGRVIWYRCDYEALDDGSVLLMPVFTENLSLLGHPELKLHPQSNQVPVEVRVRDALICYIDGTDFGEGKPPDKRWFVVNGVPHLFG